MFERRAVRWLAITGGAFGGVLLFFIVLWYGGWFFPLVSYGIAFKQRWDVPGATEAAKPWDIGGARRPVPATSDDLFDPLHVWPLRLQFSAEEWEALGPNYVPPPSLDTFRNSGGFPFRNPNASRSGLAGMLGFDFPWSRADFVFNDQTWARVGVRFRGNGTFVNSLFGDKRSFKIDVNRNVKGQRLAGVRELNVNNLIEDYSCLSDALAYECFRRSGVPAPRTSFGYLSVSVGETPMAKPLGLYVLIENVDKDFARNRFGRIVPIFKPVTRRLLEYLGDDWEAYAEIYDPKTRSTPAQQQRLIEFARLVSLGSDSEFESRIEGLLDFDAFGRYLATLVLLSAYDGFLSNGQNFYLYLDPESQKFGFIPWDMDVAWGAFAFASTGGTAEELEQASISTPWIGEHRLLERLMGLERFRRLYWDRLQLFLEDWFQRESLWARVDAYGSVIREPVTAESEFRRQRFEDAVTEEWPEVAPNRRLIGPARPAHAIKRFIARRVESVRAQLAGGEK